LFVTILDYVDIGRPVSQFLFIRIEHTLLNRLPKRGRDRMGDVTMCFLATAIVPGNPSGRNLFPALVAVSCPKMVLCSAVGTWGGEFPRRHGDEQPARSVHQLDVANHELLIQRYTAHRLEAVVRIRQ